MPIGEACPGPCNAEYRRAREAFLKALDAYDPLDAEQSRPLPPDIQPWPGDPVWCGRCTNRIRQELSQLDYAAAIMAAAADGHRPQSGEQRVAGSREPPSASPAGDDMEDLAAMLTGWEDRYRAARGWPAGARHGFLASRVTETSAWLMLHLDGILAEHATAEGFGAAVLEYHRDLANKAKAGRRTVRKPLRCPGCQMLLLYWTEGEDRVECRNPDCGRAMTYAEYETEVARRAGQAGAPQPAA